MYGENFSSVLFIENLKNLHLSTQEGFACDMQTKN